MYAFIENCSKDRQLIKIYFFEFENLKKKKKQYSKIPFFG